MKPITLKGVKASSGIAIGEVHLIKESPFIEMDIDGEGTNFELKRLNYALKTGINALEKLKIKAINNVGTDNANIIDAQILMLKDPLLLEGVYKRINIDGQSASFAFNGAMEEIINTFEKSDNLYIKERIVDIKDITKRVLIILADIQLDDTYRKKDIILVAEELYPSVTINLDTKYIKGIITEKGSKTSHSSILARHLGIPSIFGVNIKDLKEGSFAILDGDKGIAILNPKKETIEEANKQINEIKLEREKLLKLSNSPAKTLDGKRIHVYANISNESDLTVAKSVGAEGIGLLRTENQYMESKTFPTGDELTSFYKNSLKSFSPNKVVIRTLDIGGDKNLPYFEQELESNPFLGKRGIRFSLSYPKLFKTQLNALMRSSNSGNLYVMFPMISTVQELIAAKELIKEQIDDLTSQSIKVKPPKIGIMIEVPSALLAFEKFIPYIDFISIGTNDLIQYLFAADRMNEDVASLYQPYHPVVLSAIKNIIATAKKYNVEASVCGEMAGSPKQALLLVGLGVNELSMHANVIPEIKHLLSLVSSKDLKKLANDAIELNTNNEVAKLVSDFVEKLW